MLEFIQIAKLEAECKDIREQAVACDCALIALLIRKGMLTLEEYEKELVIQTAMVDQAVARKRDTTA